MMGITTPYRTDIICNARSDSVICDLTPPPTGKRGRPAKHGRHLSLEEDFVLSAEKIGDYYLGVRRVLSNLFGQREILAYVTATEKNKVPGVYFQHYFSKSDRTFLCMAGKSAAEPDWK